MFGYLKASRYIPLFNLLDQILKHFIAYYIELHINNALIDYISI